MFSSVRPYEPGDDVRTIDWKVTARTGEAYIKQYVEERELTVMLLFDASPSVFFGTFDRQKRDLAAELGASLAYSAISNNDKVGLLIFSDHVEHYIKPAKGSKHVLRLIRDLLTFESSGQGTDLAGALQTLNRTLKRDAIVFVISDFLLDPATYERELSVTGQRHDAIAVVISDPMETAMPEVGLLGLRDAETNTVEWVDTRSPEWRRQFEERQQRFQQQREEVLSRSYVDRIDIQPTSDPIDALKRFFERRMRRLSQR